MQIVVLGAGAVGSVLGGLLASRKHDVCLVARSEHVAAVAEKGLRLRSATGDYVVHPRVTDSLQDAGIDGDTCVFLTVKSQATQEAVEQLAGVAPPETAVVSFQNGVGNEDVIAEKFENTFGGVCRMTCSMLQPGHASFRRLGRVIVGKYPKGAHALAKELGKAFADASLDACVSRNIIADKWLKLAVNTQSAWHAVVDPRDHDANEFFELKAATLEETGKVFKAGKIKAKSFDGRDPTIQEMIADLRRPRARRTEHGMKVHNSTWQDLYLKRATIEVPLFHGRVIEIAREHGVAVPRNETALEIVGRCHSEGTGPGAHRLSEVLEAVARRS